jgi:hypothetical protein
MPLPILAVSIFNLPVAETANRQLLRAAHPKLPIPLTGKKLSLAVLKVELEKLGVVWRQVQRTRQRDAVYEFLEAVYCVVSKFNRAGSGGRLLNVHALHSMSCGVQVHTFSGVCHLRRRHHAGCQMCFRSDRWSRLSTLISLGSSYPSRAVSYLWGFLGMSFPAAVCYRSTCQSRCHRDHHLHRLSCQPCNCLALDKTHTFPRQKHRHPNCRPYF